MDNPEGFLTALQLGDSFFPSGAFAHSSGLETFVADGLVTDRRGMVRFIESFLLGLVARCDLIFVRLALLFGHPGRSGGRRPARPPYPCHEMLEGAAAGKHADGKAGPAGHEGPVSHLALVQQLGRGLEDGELRGHHPVMFGAVCGSIGMDVESTLLTYVYATVSSLVSAGVRLIPLGHSDGQRALHDLKRLMTSVAKDAELLGEADISTFAPGAGDTGHAARVSPHPAVQVIGVDHEEACKDRGRRSGRIGKNGTHRKTVPGPVAGILHGGGDERYLHEGRRRVPHTGRCPARGADQWA